MDHDSPQNEQRSAPSEEIRDIIVVGSTSEVSYQFVRIRQRNHVDIYIENRYRPSGPHFSYHASGEMHEVYIDQHGRKVYSPLESGPRIDEFGGRAGIIGLGHDTRDGFLLKTGDILFRNLTVVGNLIFPIDTPRKMIDFLLLHNISLDRIVTHKFPLEKALEALELFDTGRCKYGGLDHLCPALAYLEGIHTKQGSESFALNIRGVGGDAVTSRLLLTGSTCNL